MAARVVMVLGLAACVSGGGLFGYQLHSYNDMRQWPALQARTFFAPGFTRLKIDPHYMHDKDFCHRHGFTTADCLVFNHDTPDLQETYNTSLQLAAGLKLLPNSVIALCGKSADPCLSPSVLELFDNMLNSIKDTVAANNITIILDGSLAPGATSRCLWDKWLPWSSTWINGEDVQGAATSNNGYFNRFQVLNMKCCSGSITAMQNMDPPFGKFPNVSKQFPFQLWEPIDEPTMRDVKSTYAASDAAKQGIELLYAINQDPVQMLNYVYSETSQMQEATTVISADGTVFTYANGHWGDATAATSHTIVMIQTCGTYVVTYDNATGTIQQLSGGNTVSLSVKVDNVVALQCGVQSDVFVYATADGKVVGSVSGLMMQVASTVQSGYYLYGSAFVFSNGTHVLGAANNALNVLGVGSDLRATLHKQDVVFTVTNGYCYNCEVFNKRPTPRMCDQVPTPQVNVMTITKIMAADLVTSIARSSLAMPMMHSCNTVALHGSFGVGRLPVPTATLRVYYLPLETVSSSTCPSECGCPVPAAAGEGYRVFTLPSTI